VDSGYCWKRLKEEDYLVDPSVSALKFLEISKPQNNPDNVNWDNIENEIDQYLLEDSDSESTNSEADSPIAPESLPGGATTHSLGEDDDWLTLEIESELKTVESPEEPKSKRKKEYSSDSEHSIYKKLSI
jgi:hypothetical protein